MSTERDDDDDEPKMFLLAGGQVLTNVHSERLCEGRSYGCALHDPRGHMKDWPLRMTERGWLERICEHGVGHNDVSDEAFWAEQGVTVQHGCDGCCGTDQLLTTADI